MNRTDVLKLINTPLQTTQDLLQFIDVVKSLIIQSVRKLIVLWK